MLFGKWEEGSLRVLASLSQLLQTIKANLSNDSEEEKTIFANSPIAKIPQVPRKHEFSNSGSADNSATKQEAVLEKQETFAAAMISYKTKETNQEHQ